MQITNVFGYFFLQYEKRVAWLYFLGSATLKKEIRNFHLMIQTFVVHFLDAFVGSLFPKKDRKKTLL